MEQPVPIKKSPRKKAKLSTQHVRETVTTKNYCYVCSDSSYSFHNAKTYSKCTTCNVHVHKKCFKKHTEP